jgi:hypothetical protein
MTVQAPPGTVIYESAEALARSVAAWVCRQAQASAGRFALCLCGGSTPRQLYAALAAAGARDGFPWDEAHWFWGAELSLRSRRRQRTDGNTGRKRAINSLDMSIGIARPCPGLWRSLEALLRRLDPLQPEVGLRRNNSDSFRRYGEAFAASARVGPPNPRRARTMLIVSRRQPATQTLSDAMPSASFRKGAFFAGSAGPPLDSDWGAIVRQRPQSGVPSRRTRALLRARAVSGQLHQVNSGWRRPREGS